MDLPYDTPGKAYELKAYFKIPTSVRGENQVTNVMR